jgi:hypothetical protein
MTTIAVMQPYLWPYAGYYRLLAASDVFVVYDCVQFIRRGRIHRNEFDTGSGADWFTLSLDRPGFTDRIDAVRLSAAAVDEAALRLRRFPRLAAGLAALAQAGGPPPIQAGTLLADLLVAHLAWVARLLRLPCRVLRSSSLALRDELRGEQRILALCEALGARRYVNVDGGRTLYDPARFAERGVELRFLAPYRGPFTSVHERLAGRLDDQDAAARAIRAEIDDNLVYA